MAGTSIEGKNCKVTLGATSVLGIGNWKYTPGASDELDNTEFGDTTEKILLGIRKRGTIAFEGLAKLGDTTGQEVLKRAQVNAVDITTLRFYENNTSYLSPNQTTGYHSPGSTTGNSTQYSWVNITAFDMTADKNGLGRISFSGVVNGDLTEV